MSGSFCFFATCRRCPVHGASPYFVSKRRLGMRLDGAEEEMWVKKGEGNEMVGVEDEGLNRSFESYEGNELGLVLSLFSDNLSSYSAFWRGCRRVIDVAG